MGKLIYIETRVNFELKNLVDSICKARGMHISDFLRGLVMRELTEHNYLDDYTRLAFGLKEGGLEK